MCKILLYTIYNCNTVCHKKKTPELTLTTHFEKVKSVLVIESILTKKLCPREIHKNFCFTSDLDQILTDLRIYQKKIIRSTE